MFAPLLLADASFEERWRAFLIEHADESEPPLYVALGDLADHLIERLRRGDTDGLDGVFDVVERWHVEGDDYVREAASVGLLESLQNRLGGNDRGKVIDTVRASDFEPYLGAQTRQWWEKLYRFWDGDAAALRPNS